MKNISDVMKQKEREIQVKQREIQQLESDMETLRAAMRLLAEDGEAVLSRASGTHNIAPTTRPNNGEVKQFP